MPFNYRSLVYSRIEDHYQANRRRYNFRQHPESGSSRHQIWRHKQGHHRDDLLYVRNWSSQRQKKEAQKLNFKELPFSSIKITYLNASAKASHKP